MNKVLDWSKRNWVVVLMVAIAVIAPAAMLIVSAGMAERNRERLATEIRQDVNDITGSTVTYTIPALMEGELGVRVVGTPNPRWTEFFKGKRDELAQTASQALEQAIEFNRAGREPLVDGLFPEPARVLADSKRIEMARRFMSVHREILSPLSPGSPPDPAGVQMTLNDLQQQELNRLQTVNAGAPPSEEQRKEVQELLRQQRLALYSDRADRIGVYAEPGVFSNIPTSIPDAPPTMLQCYDWQWIYWIHRDIVEAIALANRTSGAGRGIGEAVVKRIDMVNVLPADMSGPRSMDATRGGRGRGGGPVGPASAPVRDFLQPNYAVSPTGRYSGATSGNQVYDVRDVQLQLIVSASRLPVLFDALSATNFMTVKDLNIQSIDPVAELRAGYDFRAEPVVAVSMVVETVWLRDWTRAFMPAEVKQALGVVEPEGD